MQDVSSRQRRTGWAFVAVQAVLLVALVLVPAADDWPTPPWVLALASVLTLGGMIVIVVTAFRLGRSLTASPIPSGGAHLHTDGLHRWVRHPMYSGLLVLVAGVVLRSANLVALVIGAIIVVFFHRKAVWEEQRLHDRFPEYAAYAAATPRFVPRLIGRRARS